MSHKCARKEQRLSRKSASSKTRFGVYKSCTGIVSVAGSNPAGPISLFVYKSEVGAEKLLGGFDQGSASLGLTTV